MASASANTHASPTETLNYFRLCRLLVDVGTKVLRETFDKIHPPASLHDELLSHPVRASLERLYKGKDKILSPIQWRKLFPSNPSHVSSQNFDITLLTVLLKKVSGLNPPTTGWEWPPPATDTSTEADIIRVRVFRDKINDHANKAYIDNHAFYGYWEDIRQTLIRLGGDRYGPFIDKLKVDCMDPDIGLHYQELVKQWKEDESKIDPIEGNVGCLYAESEDISLLEPTVDFKSTSKQGTTKAALRAVIKSFQSWRKRKAPICSRAAAFRPKANPLNKELNFHEVSAKDGVNRLTSEKFHTEETQKASEIVVARLDEAINLQQSDHIAGAREKLQFVFQTVRDLGPRFFSNQTEDSPRVLSRGKDLFLEDSVSCSVKHGILLLDSSNCEAQFYSGLLNVIGAFASVISEFKMAQETFSLLIDFHRQSDETSEHNLGAAYNNRGCISLVLGDLKQAQCDFKESMTHLQSAKELHQRYNLLLETMSVAVNSNIGRLHLISRNYSKALEKQVALVETCKSKEVNGLPLQVVFTLLNNLAVLYTTLGKFSKAEQELKWMVLYCYKMNREDCDHLLNFVALHRSEILLFHGKTKEAEKAFTLDVDDIDLVEMFGGLHINVRIETVEKLADVIVLKGKLRFACQLLETGVNILKSTFGPDHFHVASLLYKHGTILIRAGEVSDAEEKFKRSMKILEKIFGIKHPLLLKCYMYLGELALRSKRAGESYFYFQRTMENIEAIYQVSFVNQLSRKYLEITGSNTFHQSKMLEDPWKIESLVAEHGVVLAVLLSRPVVQDDIPPLRRTRNNVDVQCPDSKEIVSFKFTSDFLQTGQIFLREGMKKEAAAFFQQARKHSLALDATRGPVYACIARLFDVLTERRLGNRETLENKHEIVNCLNGLNEVSVTISNEISSKRSTEGATATTTTTTAATATASTMATCDDQLNLRLVLIFLILLSIELKMIDMTFAAYDLYSRISLNEDGFLHVLNGEVQLYASKTSISCNGKTALQDILVSSAFGLNEIDSQQPLPDGELYRSLAVKRNAQTDSFLVAYTSTVFLDIEELRALDRKVSVSVRECFQQKCFETGVEDSATQVVVDLTTTTSTWDHHNALLTGSRVELLSLCLLQGAIGEIPQGGNISEIPTAMCQKTFRFAFQDEQTSYFMFNKSAFYLLKQCSSVKISTLSVQHHCLSLTITHPVKARVKLWRKARSVSQKIQLVQTKTRKDMADWTVPRQGCSAELEGDFAAAEGLFLPAISHLANAYQVPCKTVEYSDDPPDVSDVQCEQSGFLLDGRQQKERNVVSLRMEKSETLRKNLNAIILEQLTIVSELSSLLREDAIQEGDNDFAAEVHRASRSRLPTSSQIQLEQGEVTSSECSIQPSTLIPEANIQSRHSSCEAPNLAGEEETSEARETYSTLREEEDHNLLGRKLFEKDRDSRRSLITELHHEMTRKSNLISQEDGPSDELTQQVGSRVIDPQNAATCHTPTSHNDLTRNDITNSSFENWALNPNLMEKQSIPHQKDDEDAQERHPLEKDIQSTGSPIAESKRSKKEEVFSTWNNKIPANEDSVEDQGLYENQEFESSPVPGQSARMAKDEVDQSLTGTAMNDSKTQIRTENVILDNQYRANYSSYSQTQHQQDVIERQTKHTILEGEMHETSSPMEIVEEYICQQRDERGSRDGQNEPLVHKDSPQAFTIPNLTKREKSRSSLNVYDDTVPDGPIRTFNGMHDSSIDIMPSRYTDVVDGPLKTVENNRQIQSGLLSENANGISTSRRQIVDESSWEELHPGARRDDKTRACQQRTKDTTLRNPQLAFLEGDVLVDGGATDSLRKEDKMVNDAALTGVAFTTCQDDTKGICKNKIKPFPSDTSRDAVDGRVYYLRSEDPRGFGGARPKQISPNSTGRNSSTKTKITAPISAYSHIETGKIGLKPGFLVRHAIRGNGAILDLPPQDDWNEPNFSAESCKNVTYGDTLLLPEEGINPPGYTWIASNQGLYAQAAFAARTSTQGTTHLPAIHQEPSLNQKESWHFPPHESPNGDQGLCVSQQNVSQSENLFISNVKALFSGHGSRGAYDEMDSMSDEYQNSMGNVDSAMVKSPAVRCGHYSSTKDSTSSLLGSLQQIMSKTVSLIASRNAMTVQPQKEPKEVVKLSIQEEARGRREQEQAVRTGVDDSRNQEESTQDNRETESHPILTPVQETPRPVCSHYQRRCLVSFSCCGKFYPCHRCHNESKDCSNDQARATNATHIRCSICYHEQVIDEQSQTCGGCKSKMSEYFCSICKHFTSVDKNPFHCDKCGICRIHRDRSFHCDVCNVCLDKRLQGKHKCRPDSGHDECCICLEDAFSGCQILPCSHKVHKDCAVAMLQNGIRSCPVCRHPLFNESQNSPQ